YLTVSRGGALALGAGILALLALSPRRRDTLATLVTTGLGAAILIRAAAARDALASGAATPQALHEGDQLLVILIVVAAGVALLQVALGLAARHLDLPQLSPRATAVVAAVAIVVAVPAAFVAGDLPQRWDDFKAPPGAVTPGAENTVFERLQA